MSSLHFLKISLLFPKLQGETGSDWTASTANQSSSPAPNSCWSHKPRVPRHSRGPVSVSIRGMQTFDADIRSCLQGLFSTHGFAVAAKRGALARITLVAIANVTHPVLAPVATEEESAAGWNDRPRIAALSTCQWQNERSALVLGVTRCGRCARGHRASRTGW